MSGGPPASARAISDALAGLGTHAQPLSDAQLAVAEQAEGSAGLVARLSNALYGSALVQVRNAELAAPGGDGGRGYRHEAWAATGVTSPDGVLLLHYAAARLSAELQSIMQQLSADHGMMAAASRAGEALTLLLEVCTMPSMDGPRAGIVTTNLTRAADQLVTAADRIDGLFAAAAQAPDPAAPPLPRRRHRQTRRWRATD